jgi:hypothetical protein
VAERDILDVEEDLVLALAVPDLMAGVAGIREDRAHRALRPGDAAAVRVPLPVVRGGARYAVARETFGGRC